MKKYAVAFVFAVVTLSASGYARAEQAVTGSEMMQVHQCPKCAYTASDKCPMCGAKMEKKSMTAYEAQAAIEKSMANNRAH